MTAGAGLVSGEGVRLDLVRAGIASRTIATVIDLAIQFAAVLAITVILAQFIGGDDDAATAALLVAVLVLVFAGYPIVLEWLTRGRTVGKIAMGLRVVRDDGGPIGFRQALVRGLSSLILEKPGLAFPLTTAAGVITLTGGAGDKRIGDHLAGTIVLDERASPQPFATPAPYVPLALVPWVQSADLRRIDDTLALRLRQFVGRAYAMSPAAQHDLGRRLYDRVLDVVTPPPPRDAPVPVVLTTVLAERRRRAQFPSAASTPRPARSASSEAPSESSTGFVAPS